jgi:hypothetical protein
MELGLAAAILDNAGSKAFENSCLCKFQNYFVPKFVTTTLLMFFLYILAGEYAISSKNDSPSLGWSNTLKLKVKKQTTSLKYIQ